jgi:hypothetical protein
MENLKKERNPPSKPHKPLSIPRPSKSEKFKFNVKEPISAFKYDPNSNKWITIDPEKERHSHPPIDMPMVKIATWNILFDFHETDKIFTAERLPMVSKSSYRFVDSEWTHGVKIIGRSTLH